MAAAQGHHAEALKWGREALAEFEAVGVAVGSYSARLVIAESLIATTQQLDQAQAMLDATLQYYREQKSDIANAQKIDRASLRERVCQYVEISVNAVQLKKHILHYHLI